MSKKLIAGAGVVASLAVALAPLATYASPAGNYTAGTDSFTINVLANCSLKPNDPTYTAFSNAYSASVIAGNDWEVTSTSDSTFDIACNAGAKYTISAAATALTHSDLTTTLAANTYGVKWDSETSYTNFGSTGALTLVSEAVHPGTDVTFAVTGYKGATQASTKSGNYTGSVTYTVTFIDAVSGS